MNKYAIISGVNSNICTKLNCLGYKLIYTHNVDGFISYEQKHADMQCLVVDSKIFVLSNCVELGESLKILGFDVEYTRNIANGKYPKNILLNAKIVGKNLIGKIKHLDKNLVNYCVNKGYKLIDVNQGYTGCSCAKVSDKAIITADPSIYSQLKDSDIDVLKISEGNIKLNGAEESTIGFIGGASVLLEDNKILFFGEIQKHPDYLKIKDFCYNKGVQIISINNMPMTDIGGAILLNI